MKMSTLSSLFVLLSVVSMIAIAPSAFADHENVTVDMAVGSGAQGCEETDECYLPSTVTGFGMKQSGAHSWLLAEPATASIVTSVWSAKAFGAIATIETTDKRTKSELNVLIFM